MRQPVEKLFSLPLLILAGRSCERQQLARSTWLPLTPVVTWMKELYAYIYLLMMSSGAGIIVHCLTS